MQSLEPLDEEEFFSVQNVKRRKFCSVILISLAFLAEHICFYSLRAQLLLFLQTELKWDTESITRVNIILTSCFEVAAGLGGILCDFFLHRFLLLMISYLSYLFGIFGLLLLQLNSKKINHLHTPIICNAAQNNSYSFFIEIDSNGSHRCHAALTLIIFIIGFGSGCIRVILFVIGADQVRNIGARCVSVYIFATYAIIQLAIFVSYLSVYFYDVLDYKNSNMGFLIVLISCLTVSCFLFIIGRPFYEMKTTSIKLVDLKTTVKAIFTSRKCNDPELQLYSVYDRAKLKLNEEYNDLVHSVKHFFYSLLLYILMLPACMLLSMPDLFNLQAMHLKIPSYYNEVFKEWHFISIATIVLMAPLFSLINFRYLSKDNVFSFKVRIIWGTVCGILAFCLAGVIETIRLNIFWNSDGSDDFKRVHTPQMTIGGASYTSADLSVFVLTPVYILLGVSEALTIVTAIEFVYMTNAPWFRFTSIGLIWTTFGIGNAFDRIFTSQLNGILYDQSNLNRRIVSNISSSPDGHSRVMWQSHLDYFWYIMTGFIMLLFVTFYFALQKLQPGYLQKSFMGLEERLLVEDDDEPEDSDEEFTYSGYRPL